MLNRTILCGAAIAPWLMLTPASASCGSDIHASFGQVTVDDLAALGAWAAAQTGLQPAETPPHIEYRSPAELASLRHGASFAHTGSVVVALYDSGTRTILLSNEWRGSSVAARSVIVHEMVHHLQHENGKRFACVAEQEAQAFVVQEAWLAAHGTTLEKEFGIDPFTRMVASLCPY